MNILILNFKKDVDNNLSNIINNQNMHDTHWWISSKEKDFVVETIKSKKFCESDITRINDENRKDRFRLLVELIESFSKDNALVIINGRSDKRIYGMMKKFLKKQNISILEIS